MDRSVLVARREELQAAVDAARQRLDQNAGAVAAYDEIIALFDATEGATLNPPAANATEAHKED